MASPAPQARRELLGAVPGLALAVALLVVAGGTARANDYYNSIESASPANRTWMSGVPDATSLAWLSVPGTHDSLALCGQADDPAGEGNCEAVTTSITKTQESHGFSAETLTTQLNTGIRSLDIRARANKDDSGLQFTIHDLGARRRLHLALPPVAVVPRAAPGGRLRRPLRRHDAARRPGRPRAARLPGEPEPVPVPPRTSGGYAKDAADFDSDHFAVWGRRAAQDKSLIRAQVEKYQPDLLLVGLGFNDMGWFVSDAPGTLASVKSLVDEARAADWGDNLRVSTNRYDDTWIIEGQKREYQVRTDTGDGVESAWSDTVSATAHPKTAAGPVGVVTRPTATGVDIVRGIPSGPYTDGIASTATRPSPMTSTTPVRSSTASEPATSPSTWTT
ncbi:hypothetical protein [Streptomyces sp. NPDC006012]|uniref:hypothetical protein n=1 Tax=Streptomyces sp. NPDC006012 TaxID=3364739 RepID=UPI0036C62A81